MGVFKYLVKAWKNEGVDKDTLVIWRRQPTTHRIDYPSRKDRAHALGFIAKQGIFIVRQRVPRGGHKREDWSGGRHSHNMSARLILHKSYQVIAEERANEKYVNCEVLNSYFVGKDGKHYWYEVILADRTSPSVVADKRTAWVSEPQHKGRVYRGLTSAGRKSRGQRHKGMGTEKTRPSRGA